MWSKLINSNLFIVTVLAVLGWLSSCEFPKKETQKPDAAMEKKLSELPLVTAVTREGVLRFASGDSMSIPHYGEQGYLTVFMVRHCEKDRSQSDNPPLTAEGQARAERLGRIFDNAILDKICTTNTKRTVDTGLAVKRWAGDPPMETFPVEAQKDWMQENLEEGSGRRILYVGHQNTVPMLLNDLTGTIDYKIIGELEFGHFYIAVTSGVKKTDVFHFQY